MRILSVDDNAENLYLIEAMVRAHGHEVVSATNGMEALAKLAIESFDLIVSDILMPVMDGFQFCRTVKSDARLKHVPFVFYTATYIEEKDEELGLALGASRFIVKPVEPEEFLGMIEQVVREAENGILSNPNVDVEQDVGNLSLYNERLVRKLERKIQQLEGARRELEASIEQRNREIAQRRKAEEALMQSDRQLRLIWDASLDGILLTDRDGVILRANPALARIYAKPLDSLIGQLFTSVYGEDSEKALANYREEVQFHPAEAHFETAFRRWDGQQVWIEGSRKTIQFPSGPVAFSILRDVTERKLSEQERAALEEQLRQAQKLESVGRLAGGIAHDFNNLLTVINGYSELVLRQLQAGDPLRSRVEEIHRAGERASNLTQQLLSFSRKQALRPQVLDLNRVVEDTRPMLDRLVGEDVRLLVKLNPKAAVTYADPHQMAQVLMNLAVNARDAMPRGGELRIETSIERGRKETPARSGERADRYVVLTVGDEGEGMAEETRRQIFDPFFTTKAVGKGTGLGLSMVQGIVAQSGGSIEVHSELGHGTTFRIWLPAVDDVPSEPERPQAASGLRGSETVLVVEDQEDVRKYVAAALRSYGYRVIAAVDAENALQVCEREGGRFDLLLTDVVMPNGSGKELADRVTERWPKIAVLFMSGYADEAVTIKGLSAEVNFIQKPFSPGQLASKVREIL